MPKMNRGDKGDRKKVSWMYRKKAKLRRSNHNPEITDEKTQVQNRKARIIVRNLPFKATEDEVKTFYEVFGQIEEINLLKHLDGKSVGCGFVQFKRVEDASRAIFNTNKKEFLGRIINSSWAISKSKFCEKLERGIADSVAETVGVAKDTEGAVKDTQEETKKEPVKDCLFKKPISTEDKQKSRKTNKEKNRKRRARVVVRNLSFKATAEDLRDHFKEFGGIEEVKILTRGDGKNVGCAFVQFELVQSAAKAIHHANLKPLLDRPIVVDWAVAKDKFGKDAVKQENDVEIKNEPESESETQSTKKEKRTGPSEESDNNQDIDASVNTQESDDSENDVAIQEGNEAEDEKNDESEEEKSEPRESKEYELEEEIDEDDETMETRKEKRPRRESHDISEGKTVFLKNLPFSVKSDQLKSYMERFGPVFYALVCIDSLTEHSKGTAFVKFRNVEDAEKCLAAGNELRIEDEIVEAHKALERNEVEDKASLRQRREKDTRNLYLVKEGVIMAGSPAATGVSGGDMARRLQLEQWKSQMLRNLNMFVARTRLVVHNLPVAMDDAKLRTIFEKHSGPKAVIREARVMRDMRNFDGRGVARSKEYGFVSFTTHEDAIKALRSINNNPNVFGKNKRPIVAFSIENRIMVNAKQKRVQKSRERNPLWPGNNSKRKHEGNEIRGAKRSRPERGVEPETTPYSGVIGKRGQNKLRSRFSLKTQAAVHHQALKKEKKQSKCARKLDAKRKEAARSRKEVKVKQGTKFKADDVHFSKLVSLYKDKLQAVDLKKSKWYDA